MEGGLPVVASPPVLCCCTCSRQPSNADLLYLQSPALQRRPIVPTTISPSASTCCTCSRQPSSAVLLHLQPPALQPGAAPLQSPALQRLYLLLLQLLARATSCSRLSVLLPISYPRLAACVHSGPIHFCRSRTDGLFTGA